MGEATNKPEYTGMDKYPGWIATIITIIVGAVFVGALVMSGNGDHASDGTSHSEAHDAAPAGDAKGH